MLSDPGLNPHLDDERFVCRLCRAVFTDAEHSASLPVEMGDSGLLVHVGVCFQCSKPAIGEEMAEIFSEIHRQEAWQATEDHIDQQVRLNFPDAKRRPPKARRELHVCAPPTDHSEQGYGREWRCPECKKLWRKPPWYGTYSPVSE